MYTHCYNFITFKLGKAKGQILEKIKNCFVFFQLESPFWECFGNGVILLICSLLALYTSSFKERRESDSVATLPWAFRRYLVQLKILVRSDIMDSCCYFSIYSMKEINTFVPEGAAVIRECAVSLSVHYKLWAGSWRVSAVRVNLIKASRQYEIHVFFSHLL